MAFELGGRADKFGNRYERRYFVSLMAKVLQGGLLSVQSEPTGDDESGTDIIIEYQGGRKDFHQCKARNGSNEHWTMSALARHKVFQHIKEHVKTEQNHFVFVTALPFVALNDLCLAARNSDSCQRFVTDQLTTHDRKNLFDQWRKNLGLGETAADQEQAAFYLRQFEICTLSDDSVEGDQWKYVLGSMFTGNPDDVYHHIIEKPKFGYGKPYNDYGIGFYCTQNPNMAKEWGVGIDHNGYANRYKIECDGLTILDLNAPGYTMLHWLTILLENREFDTSAPLAAEAKEYLMNTFHLDYKSADIIIGYRADDSYFSFACDAFDRPAYKFLHSFKGVVQLDLLWQLHWQERKDFDFFLFHCVSPNKNRTIHADCPAKSKGERPKTLPSR